MPVFKLNDVFAGRYVLVELMGEKASYEVWKAKDLSIDETVVAIKIYVPEKGTEEEEDGVNQFRQAFSLSQRLSHPHLLKLHHFDIAEGCAYLIMPFSSRGSLTKLLEERGCLSEKQIAQVLYQIGSALDALHSQEPPVLHHDVKPDNILVAQDDYFLLADFGINPLTGHSLQKTRSESKSVTVAYAPPESFVLFDKADASGDIFSLGVTLFEMCSKTIPWDGSGGLILIKGGQVPGLPEKYSAELNELLQACMAANRANRPNARELALRGKHFLEAGSWSLPEEEDQEGNHFKSRMPYLMASAVFLLILIGAYYGYINNHLAIPTERIQKMTTSLDEKQKVDEMLIVTLENELKEVAKRARELEEENKQLVRNDSLSNRLLKSQKQLILEYQTQFASKNQVNPKITEKSQRLASAPAAAPKKDNTVFLPVELEKQLNKISDPELSGNERKVWKQETMAQFSEGTVRILDETEGASKQYSASIFLNLLFNVPHTIAVKEVKRDQDKKVTELRLTMKTKM